MDDEKLTEFRSSLNLYTPLQEAKEEIWRRWNDISLRNEISKFARNIPEFLINEPKALIYRQIASPNFELCRASDLSKKLGLELVCTEYHEDNFCVHNPDKLHLAKMVFVQGKNKRGRHITCHKNIISFNEVKASEFRNIETTWGDSFISFHHHILGLSDIDIRLFDFSSWFRCNGQKAAKTYPHFLSLFISHGILLENFLVNSINYDKETKFTYDIILPAFDKVNQMFGFKPLIVPLFTPEEEGDLYWMYYPDHLKPEVEKFMNGARLNSEAINVHGK